MPPEQAIQSLRQALNDNPATNVLVAAEPGGTAVFQRLNLRQELANEFRGTAQDAIPDNDLTFRPYEPGYTPDWNELTIYRPRRR